MRDLTTYVCVSPYANAEEIVEHTPLYKFNTNVVGTVHAINAFLPLIKAGTLKKVVAISSALGDLEYTRFMERPYSAPYSISKAALTMAVTKYAMKYKQEGIVFLSICPGLVNTRVTPREYCSCLRALAVSFPLLNALCSD